MVAQSFVAFDNDSLVVLSSPNGAIVGNGVINNSDTPNGTTFLYTANGGSRVTIDDTGGAPDVFNDDIPGGHTVIDGGGLVADGTPVESESFITLRALDSAGNQTGPEITINVFSQNGVFSDVWGFGTRELLQDGVTYVKISGSNFGSSPYDEFVTCFGPGTNVLTEIGERPIDSLSIGDRIWTKHNGLQPLRWIGHTEVRGKGKLAPVVIPAKALGNTQALTVSQEHRMFLTNDLADMLFGSRDVLVAAKHLCGFNGIDLAPCTSILYTHFMFDGHQIVRANGCLSESFFFSENALNGATEAQRAELVALFPSLQAGLKDFGKTAAMTLRRYEAALLMDGLAQQEAHSPLPRDHAA